MKNNFIKTIIMLFKQIPEKLQKEIILVGSVNLLLQGVNVIPKKDIDFATNYKNVNEIASFLKDITISHCMSFNGNNGLPFAHLFIKVDNIEVEFFDAIDTTNSYYSQYVILKNIIELKIDDKTKIKCLNLETEYDVNQKAGKFEKALLIKKKLTNS